MKFDDPLDALLFHLFHGILIASPFVTVLWLLWG